MDAATTRSMTSSQHVIASGLAIEILHPFLVLPAGKLRASGLFAAESQVARSAVDNDESQASNFTINFDGMDDETNSA